MGKREIQILIFRITVEQHTAGPLKIEKPMQTAIHIRALAFQFPLSSAQATSQI
jgi:hypothetical protein